MPTKTPLLGALRSFFRDAQIAKAHALSIDALREVRAVHAERAQRRGVSRRTFLSAAGAAAAASVVPRVSLAARAPTVVIVGGGIAGMNCALELADVLFVTFCLANSQGIDLDQAFERMMQKVTTRDADRWTKKAR